ncbi:MAG: PAS domain S-box protein [Elusimicrobia bacterium]|nr:PAS domain S-box protein [Elusimicrobiota bacterium]
MRPRERESGLPSVDALPWGTHFCCFHQTDQDLLDLLVPFFKAGLDHDEACLWEVSGSLSVSAAAQALAKAVPALERRQRQGQVRIMPAGSTLPSDGAAEQDLVRSLDEAMTHGFAGLRLARGAAPSRPGARDFVSPGAQAVRRLNVLAAFTYPRAPFNASALMEVVQSHRFALLRDARGWEVIEGSAARAGKDALKDTEEILRSVFANMSEGFAYHRILLDSSGKPVDYVFLEVNQAFEELTGLKADDIVGRRVTEALPGIEEDPSDWIGRYGKVALTGEAVRFESHAAALGKWFAVSAFSPHRGFFAAIFSDITTRKDAEQSLRESEERFRAITESSLTLIAVSRVSDGTILFTNAAYDRAVAYAPGELIGRKAPELYADPADHRRVLAALERDGFLRDFELEIIKKDGARCWLSYSSRLIRFKGEAAVLGASVDVTERRRATEQLRQAHAELEARVAERTADLDAANAELKRSNAELEQFAHVASHDLQEPLRMVASFTQLLARRYKGKLDQQADEYIAFAVSGAVRMQELVAGLLEFSRISRQSSVSKEVSCGTELSAALIQLRLSLDEAGAQVDCGPMPTIVADPVQLRRLFQNLIANAVKFRKQDAPPRIRVAASEDAREWRFSIEDNGIGIESSQIPRLFRIYQRLHRREDIPGHGLGLAICRRIVEHSGGRIWVESEPGKGSTFHFTLPKQRSPRDAATSTEPAR